MAVVEVNGSLVMSKLRGGPPQDLPKVAVNGGRKRIALDRVSVTSGDSVNSTYYLARLPATAVLMPTESCYIEFEAFGGTSTIDIGSSNDVNFLLDAGDPSSAGRLDIGPAIADAGKELWELAGYSTRRDAPAEIDIYMTLLTAAATNSADLIAVFEYTED